jgi:hypothetical protein
MKPSNCVAATILAILSTSLSMVFLHVLHVDLEDLAYSIFHGFGGFAIESNCFGIQCSERTNDTVVRTAEDKKE